jgi:eukaryotic-like serine/threonine-protein kinase
MSNPRVDDRSDARQAAPSTPADTESTFDLVERIKSGDREDLDRPAITGQADPASSLGNWAHLTLVERLGGGTFGEVYRAWDPLLEREVALKLLLCDDPGWNASRILHEGRLMARVHHPNVITVHGVAAEGARVGLWLELIRGATLEQALLKQGRFSAREAALIGIDLCRALAAIHAAGLIHRDVTPQNVMREDGGRIVLMDLGTGRAIDTGDGLAWPDVAGTPLYLAPEIFHGSPASVRSDIYSLGVLLYHLVTGSHPVRATTVEELRAGHAQSKAVRLRDARADLPTVFVQVIGRAIASDPDRRHDSAGALEADLVQALGVEDVLPTSIAVLPFANLSSDGENEYFSDGLTEELINALSQLEDLRVVSRTSVFEFKGKALNIRTVGGRLGVSTVLEGSVRKSGDRVRITVQLVKVSDGCQLWATRFDRKMTDIFEIQDEIAHTIAAKLQITLTDRGGEPLVKRYTRDLEAYHLYLKGRFHWNRRSSEGFEKAREYFEAALARDARYGPAYAGLADYHISVASWGLAPPDVAWPNARAAAMKALDVDSSLADAHVSLAAFKTYYERNWAEGEREFQRARQLNPGDTNARVQYATYLTHLGRLDEARSETEEALLIDPLSATVNTCAAGVAYYSRQYDRAIDMCRKALELCPDDIELFCILALSYEGKGSLAEAIEAFEAARTFSGNYPIVLASLAATYAKAGNREKARELVDQMREISRDRYVPPIAWAWIHIAFDEPDLAFDWLEKAADAHDVLLCFLAIGPTYEPLRWHSRFPALLQTIGLLSLEGDGVC